MTPHIELSEGQRAALAAMSAAERGHWFSQFAEIPEAQAEPEPDAEPEDEPERRYALGTSHFAAAYDTLNVSCALIAKYGADRAVMFAFFEKFSARGGKEFFGGQPLLEAFTGFTKYKYQQREALIADGLICEREVASYDQRKRVTLNMHAKHGLVLDHAEALVVQCSEKKNWRGLVDKLQIVGVEPAEDTGLPWAKNSSMGAMEPSTEGLPSAQNSPMHGQIFRPSNKEGLTEVNPSNPLSRSNARSESERPTREEREKREQTPSDPQPVGELVQRVIARAERETNAVEQSSPATPSKPTRHLDPTSPEAVVGSMLNLSNATPAERTFVLGKLAQSPGVAKPAQWARVVLDRYRSNPPKENATTAQAPPMVGPDGLSVLHNPALQTIRAIEDEPRRDAPAELSGLRDALKKRFAGRGGA